MEKDKIRNYCPKHKLVYVNKCLDHDLRLCAECFHHHKDHKLSML